MKKLFLFLYFTFYIFTCPVFFGNAAFSQNPLVKQWDYRFGGTISDYLTKLIHTSDNGFLLAGHSVSDSSGDKTMHNWDTTLATSDYWIVKIDYAGNKQWDRRFGGNREDLLLAVQQTADGGFLLGGPSVSDSSGDKTHNNCIISGFGNNPTDYWTVKVDSSGNKQWDKVYGGSRADILEAIVLTADKGYVLAGYSSSNANCDKTQNVWYQSTDYWIVKIDSLGNKLWDSDLGGYHNDFLYSIQRTDDGGYILGGDSYSDSSGNKTENNWDPSLVSCDYWIVKTDSLGSKQWDKRFGGFNSDRFKVIRQTADKGYIIGGISVSDSSGDVTQHTRGWWDYWIVKTDSSGNKQWDKRFGGTNSEDDFNDIVISANGNYMLCGTSYSDASGDKSENNLGAEQMWMVMIDTSGNKIWDKTIFTDSVSGHEESGFGLILNADSCFAFAAISPAEIGGYKSQPSQGMHDFWIIKFCDSTLTTESPTLTLPGREGIAIAPNPASNEITITSQSTLTKIEISNLLGERIYHHELQTSDLRLPTSDFPNGLYIIKATTDKGVFQQKLVVNH